MVEGADETKNNSQYPIKVGTDPYSAEQLELAKHEDSNQRIRRVEK